jgi:hypothetical protein
VACGLSVLMFGLLALVPALASARAATSPSVEMGPFKEKGYAFDVVVDSCAGSSNTVIDYFKGNDLDGVDYSYSGKSTCSAASDLKHATLKLSWPGIAKISVRTGAIGRAKQARTPKGCRGGTGSSREVVLKGSLDISPAKALGRLKSARVMATLSRISNLNCRTPPLPRATELSAEFGQNQFLEAMLPRKGRRSAILSDGFTAAKGVSGLLAVFVSGTAKLFSLAKGAGTLTDLRPFASGKLTVSELPVCIGSQPGAENVTLGGQIVVNSPVLGKVVLGSGNVSSASVDNGIVSPGGCNGYGSSPLTPSVINTCATDQVCSVIESTNNDMFFDQSLLGTQTIVSETIDFGDGTTGRFAKRTGTVSHTYATAGMYTATITIKTSNGQTQTTTVPVYIDS